MITLVGLSVVALGAGELSAQGTPAGTAIRNWADATYQTANGLTLSVASDTSVVTVAQVVGLDLEPPRTTVTDPGATVVFPHTLANLGNGTDQFDVSAASRAGWPVRVHIDADQNGLLDAGDPLVAGPVVIAAADTAHLLVVVDVPALATVRGTTDTVDVGAASQFDPAATDQLLDVLSVRDVGIVVSLSKSVDRATATIGDIVSYAVMYDATGSIAATSFVLTDAIPLGTAYVPGSLRLDGAPLTDAAGDDAGAYDAAGNRIVVTIPAIAPGEAGVVTFQARLDGSGSPSNVARASYSTVAGTDSVASNAAPTTLVLPELYAEKLLESATVARVGEDVVYRIRYGNTSASVTARNVVLTDTLPVGLDYVSATPPATVAGSVLTWSVGDVAPGTAAEIVLRVRVATSVRDTVPAANDVLLASDNSPSETAVAPTVTLIGMSATQLALDKAADVLEVGLGETAPYTLTVQNTGTLPLSDIRIHDRLPAGGRYAQGSARGADSVRADGRDLTIYIAGPLAPGARHTVRYAVAVVSAEGEVLENSAYATAEAEFVRSETVTAWVRVRQGWPMETRAAIGKVWVDLNGNGLQDIGEPGVENVDVWTDDGEIVTTDRDGKFSFHNLRPGRHAYRLDPASLPAAYAAADAGAEVVVRDGDGWTTPRVNFALVPRQGTVAAVRMPVRVRFTARPICSSLAGVLPGAQGNRAAVALFETNSARPAFALDSSEIVRRLNALTVERPECGIEVVGHTDVTDVWGAPYWNNWRLSNARAEWVASTLTGGGLADPILAVGGRGPTEPVSAAVEPDSLQRNRRVEVRLVDRDPSNRAVEYQVVVANPYDAALAGVTLRFEPVATSLMVADGGPALESLGDGRWALPTIPANRRLTVLGRAHAGASATVAVAAGDGAPTRLRVEVHNPDRPLEAATVPLAPVAGLPDPAALPAGATVGVVVAAPTGGWPREAAHTVPAGWAFVTGSARYHDTELDHPRMRPGPDGDAVLLWRLPTRGDEPITLVLQPAAATQVSEPVSVAPLRSAVEREADVKQAFVRGPAVTVFAPADGAVLPSDRVYVGVRGEPGAPVALLDGDTVVAEATLRPDGVHDFIAIPVARGPHRLRVRMINSWNQERWDSLTVHVSGRPAGFATEDAPVRLVADGQRVATVRVRVLDHWGVPVTGGAFVTVAAEAAEPANEDADPSSVGLQLRSDEQGWLAIQVRGGREVRTGSLQLSTGDVSHRIPLEVMPATRPLMVTAVGRVGVGASPDAFGAVTARGRLDRRTSLVVSYDSRRLDAGREDFARSFDPLEEARYPILGDASSRRTLSASPYAFAARLERGFDWVALGDISTSGFAQGLTLAGYDRALAGAAGRLTTGPVVWQAFGSSNSQRVEQLQIRGAGVSGPYDLRPDIRPGTERITIETRALENPQRTLARQVLGRFVDYQIDYRLGLLLFKRPVPATDASGNPVFIVVTYEAESGGPASSVWGMRAALDAGALVGGDLVDSLQIGSTFIRDGRPGAERRLAGVDLKVLRHGGLEMGAEVAHSAAPDSSGFATAIEGTLTLADGAVSLSGAWQHVDREFHNPANVALQSGTEELRLGSRVKLGASEVRLEHSSQRFAAQGVTRARTSGGVVQSVGTEVQVEAGLVADRFASGASVDQSQAGELKVSWTPAPSLSLWTEARHQLGYSGSVTRPDHVGVGGRVRVGPRVSLEAFHRQVLLPGGDSYAVTNLGMRSDIGFGTEAWGSYQIAGADGAHNAAVVGLNNRLKLGNAWTVQALFERRMGLDRAPSADPVRALPFLQEEEDYWSVGLGVELLPAGSPYRLSARGELRDGDIRSSRLVTVAGDVSLSRSVALLSRHELLATEQVLAGSATTHRQYSSLNGLAIRPTGSDGLNVLAKFAYVDALNPLGGGVLATEGRETRTILAAEAIWAPLAWGEFAGRYAVRRASASIAHADGTTQDLRSLADYVGGRLDLDVTPWLGVRGEGRLLIERTSGSRRWDMAPQLVVVPVAALEVAAGYRLGDLRDPDFAVSGGAGWFVTIGAAVTEGTIASLAEFWRARLGN